MKIAEQIKIETIAAAVLLLSQVESWPMGPHREVALELGEEVLGWRRDAAESPMEPIRYALRTAPEGLAGPLRELYDLHVRMLLEQAVEEGRVRRGAKRDTYMLAPGLDPRPTH